MAYLENRVKNSLACFSDFDSKRTELVKSNSGISPSKLRSMQKLLGRIRTFSQMTWFAKPDWLSPVNCARLGWQNIDVDILECSKCKAVVSAKLPSSQNIQVYDECCKRLESLLQNGHHNCCSRKSRPVSPDVCQLTLRNRTIELDDFIGRVKGLIELKSHLPIIEESAFASLKLTMDDVVPLCRLAVNVCPSVADVDQSVLLSACLLAVCGWNVSSTSCGELVECTFCDRKIGLWNYFSHNPEFDVEGTTTMSGYYAHTDLAANNLDACMETDFCVVAGVFNTVAHDSDLQLTNENPKVLHDGEGTNGEVTGMEREESGGLADEKILDSNPGEVSEDLEMTEDLHHDLQTIVSDEQEMKEDVQHELQTTKVSHEALVTCSPFKGVRTGEIINEEETECLRFLASVVPGSNVVLITADTLRDAETCHVAEEETAVQTTCEDGNGSVKQEIVVMNDAEPGTEYPNNGGKQCQNEELSSGVEKGGEECVIGGVERGEESTSVELVSSLKGFSDIPDLSGDCVGTCNTISSSNSFGDSAVNSTQHDMSGAKVGVCGGVGDGVISGFIEGASYRSGETVMDGKKQEEPTEAVNAAASETLPSVDDNITLTSDGEVSGAVHTVGVSDSHSGGVEVQMDVGDLFQCVATADDAISGLDYYAADGFLEERSNSVREKLIESNDNAASCGSGGDLCVANLSKPVINHSNRLDVNDLPTYELTDQSTDQPTVQPAVQPTAQLTDELTDQPTSQSAVQPTAQPADQPSAQLIDVLADLSADMPTSRLTDELTNQPTAQPVDQPAAQLSDELKDQPTSQQADQPTAQPVDQPSAKLSDELKDQPISQQADQPTAQPDVQPDQATAQLTDDATDQLTEQPLIDLATVADVVELAANNERDVESHIHGSMKRTATSATPDESKSSAKRRRLARPVRGHFDPVAEHRPWCIWVQDLVTGRCRRTGGGNEDGRRDAGGRPAPRHPWIRLFHLLLQPSSSPDRRDVRRALSLFKSF